MPVAVARRVDQVCDQFETAWKAAVSTEQRPRIEDYVVLKLLAAAANRRRRARDLADVQGALEAFPERAATSLSIAGVRARLRDVYAVQGQRLKTLVALFRQVPRPARG